jgi:DNA gyrase/topoisomerase IV subunit B
MTVYGAGQITVLKGLIQRKRPEWAIGSTDRMVLLFGVGSCDNCVDEALAWTRNPL